MEEWLFIVEFGMGIPRGCSKKCHLRIFIIIIYLNNIYSLQLFQELVLIEGVYVSQIILGSVLNYSGLQ